MPKRAVVPSGKSVFYSRDKSASSKTQAEGKALFFNPPDRTPHETVTAPIRSALARVSVGQERRNDGQSDARDQNNMPLSQDSFELPQGSTFGQLTVMAEDTRDSTGVTYRAFYTIAGREVRLKILYPWLVGLPGLIDRLVDVTESLESLHHQSIAGAQEIGLFDSVVYVIYDAAAGTRLDQLVRGHGRLPLNLVLRIAVEVAAALDHAHQAGFVHGDLRLGSVVATADGLATVTGFGLATVVDDLIELASSGTILGSPDSVAPERTRGQPATTASDQYSFAAMLYELLTGVPPFMRDHPIDSIIANARDRPPRPSAVRSSLPKGFDQPLLRALAKDPRERYPSCVELAQALVAAAEGRPSQAESPPWWKRPRVVIELLAAVLILAAALALVASGLLGGGGVIPPTATRPTSTRAASGAIDSSPRIVAGVSITPTPTTLTEAAGPAPPPGKGSAIASPTAIIASAAIPDGKGEVASPTGSGTVPLHSIESSPVTVRQPSVVSSPTSAPPPSPVPSPAAAPEPTPDPRSTNGSADSSVAGGALALVRRDDRGLNSLYLTSIADGSTRRLLPDSSAWSWAAAASPDGQWLAFAIGSPPRADVAIVRRDGTGFAVVARSGEWELGSPWWLGDDRIAFNGERGSAAEIFSVSREGGAFTRLTDTSSLTTGTRIPTAPAWGNPLAFAGKKDGGGFRIYVQDGGKTTPLPVSVASAYTPAWSPSGDLIAFTGEERGGSGIYVVSPDGQGLRRVVTSARGHGVCCAVWSPDEQWLTYVGNIGSGVAPDYGDAFVVRADGSTPPVQITHDGRTYDWRSAWLP